MKDEFLLTTTLDETFPNLDLNQNNWTSACETQEGLFVCVLPEGTSLWIVTSSLTSSVHSLKMMET